MLTDALSSLASVVVSKSDTTMLALTTVAASFSVYNKAPDSTPESTGASFTGVTVTVRVTAELLASPSLITNDTTRSDDVCVPVGSSDELEYVTSRSAVCHAAAVRLPLNDSTPVPDVYV